MIIDNINIYNLIPYQIEELIKKLYDALNIVKTNKQTVSKIAESKKEKRCCPYCGRFCVVKNGHTKNNIQTYKCKDCNKRFNDLTNTVLHHTHLTYEQLEIFIQCFNDKVSLRKTAKRMKTTKDTVHLLRLKIIDSLGKIRQNTKLSGTVETDELYKNINLKGTKPQNMPRISKPRTSNGTATRGINKHKVCIASAVDENDNMFLEIVGTGPITSEMIIKSLAVKGDNIKTIITDCKSSYESVAKENEWQLKQVKSKCYVDNDGNSLANINSIHSGLTTFLSHFRGVSTKHLQSYLDWYVYDKYLNFSVIEEKHFDNVLEKTVKYSTIISNNNMYDNYSGLDFCDVYSDYNYIPSRKN